MEYKKIKTQIENAVRKSPSDPVPYEDMFSLCRDMEKEDFAKAHKWNQAFRKKISAAIRLSVTDGDMLAAEQFDNLLFRSLLFGAPHFFDDYLQAVEFGKPLDKKFYQPRRHYLKRYVDAYQEVLEGKLDFLSISMPKRAGKSQLGINFTNMLSGKFPDRSTLMEGTGDLFMGKYYDSEQKEAELFLEEFREHNPDKKMCWLWREKRQSVFICFYDVKAKKNFIQYLKQSVVPAFSMRIHDHGAFAEKECQGLGELAEIENALTEACGWHLILGNRVLIKCKKIAQLRTNRFTYPADLENQARSAVIHLDYPAFTRCFQQFMEAGLREVHSPQEIREVCIRFAYAVINTAKECGTLRDEDLLVQKILHTILNAVFWEEIMDAMLELFACIENDEKKQTSAELLVQKALSIIKECYSDGINLEETARRLHVTEQYLGTQLKKETGSSFTEIIRRYKIAHVKQLLLDTELKLNQIASMAGFSDPKYMSKVFKQEVGMLPNEYRRMNT